MESNEEIYNQVREQCHKDNCQSVSVIAISAMDEAVAQYKEEVERLNEKVEKLELDLEEKTKSSKQWCNKATEKHAAYRVLRNELTELRTHLSLKEGESIIDRVKALSQPKDIEILREEFINNFCNNANELRVYFQQKWFYEPEEVFNWFLPHLHPKEQPKESESKKIVIDVTMHEDGACTHGYVTDFNILETIGILQVSSYRMTEKFSEEDKPKN